ncbi:MAG: FAD-dependent oxidoreductase [Spirochaetota bacterium]
MKKRSSRHHAHTPAVHGLPVIASTDVAVIGGTSAAVAAAVSAAREGARVLLVASRTYFGEDIAGTLRLWLEDGESASNSPAEKIWGADRFVTPARVKKRLEDMLTEARVEFMYASLPTDIVIDENGALAGVVIANRAGRQAVIAKSIIDASDNGLIARLAGAPFHARAFSRTHARTARWVIIAETARDGEGISHRALDLPLTVFDKMGRDPISSKARWHEYTITLSADDGSLRARASIEQMIRDRTYTPGQLYASETPFYLPAACIKSDASHAHSMCRPETDYLWVVSGALDAAPDAAEMLLRPCAFMGLGDSVGIAAAKEAASRGRIAHADVSVRSKQTRSSPRGTIRIPDDARVASPERIAQKDHSLPILGTYDVVVVGGGTSGAPAGIASARSGARTLVIENLYGLGGVSTLGMIGSYWKGNRVGFTNSVPQNPIEVRMEWYRSELRSAGADIWFGVISIGACMDGNRIRGVVVATPEGAGIVLADVVIDATGNADIAIAAGAKPLYLEDDFALQESHYARREVGSSYTNGGRPSVADHDIVQMKSALKKYSEKPFDISPLFNTRERRRIEGDYILDWLDQINERTFPDSICLGKSDYDSHGYQIHPFFLMRSARVKGDYDKQFTSFVPYRSILPKGIDGMLVVGLAMSAHRDAIPIVRMQPDLHNLGFAAGTAAAMAVQGKTSLRKIDIKALQRELVYVGNLPAQVLIDRDPYPFPKSVVAQAVKDVLQNFLHLEKILAASAAALPLVRTAFVSAHGADTVRYAEVLALLGDARGLDTLIAESERIIREKEFPNKNAVTWVRSQSDPDDYERLIYALGFIRDARAAKAIGALSEHIPPVDFLKYRAVAVSLGRIAHAAAADTLAKLLMENKKRLHDLESAAAAPEDRAEIFEGEESSGVKIVPPSEPSLDDIRIRVLITAVALYRCSDSDGAAAKALQDISKGWSGAHAALATQTLASGKKKAGKA